MPTDLPISAPAEIRGPDGFAMQVVAASARSEPATTESYVIATPRASPQQPHTGRSMLSLPWRSTSCSRRAPTKRDGSCMSTPGATDVAASTAPLHRFTFGGLEPRPAPDLPPLPMDIVKGFVVDDQDKDRGAASRRDAILDARDESLKNEREALRKEREKCKENEPYSSARKTNRRKDDCAKELQPPKRSCKSAQSPKPSSERNYRHLGIRCSSANHKIKGEPQLQPKHVALWNFRRERSTT